MQPSSGGRVQSAKALVERALKLAHERAVAPSTLHLAHAALEGTGHCAQTLREAGLKPNDLRASRASAEPEGLFERVQSRARRLAVARQEGEVTVGHLLAASLTEAQSALNHVVAALGVEPAALAQTLVGGVVRGVGALAPPMQVVAAPPVQQAAAGASRLGVGGPRGESLARPGSGAGAGLMSRARLSPVDARVVAPETLKAAVTAPPSAPASRGPVRSARQVNTRVARGARAETSEVREVREAPKASGLPEGLAAWVVAPSAGEGTVGRATELARLEDALNRREGRGALLVGVPGVGRRALVRGLASRSKRHVVHLRHAAFAAQLRSDEGERLRALGAKLAAAAGDITVVLDPVTPWFSSRETPDELVAELRNLLVSGAVPWVGVATLDEGRRLAEQEPWLEKSALRIDVEELPPADVERVVLSRCAALATHHELSVDETTALDTVALTERYLGGRPQPERTLTVLDLACARARRLGEPSLRAVTVASVVAELAAMPFERVAATDGERLVALEVHLATRVVGHREALARVSRVVRRNAVGFRGTRPMGTFLFLGPTGVGKTETAKAMAETLFPGAGGMARFDMAEFAEAHSVARLVGAPPGYVGYSDGGQLTEAVRRRPYQLILLDEIEKAHRDVLESLLGLLDEGRMTDGRGRTVDFRNTVVVMTSNLGAELYAESQTPARRIGFDARSAEGPVDDRANAVLAAARGALPPELWNRIDEPLVFGPLAHSDVAEVARRLLRDSGARLAAEQKIQITAEERVVEFLLRRGGYEPSLGARPMRRAIARWVEGPLADAVLRGELRRGDRVSLTVVGDSVGWVAVDATMGPAEVPSTV
ncbi:MAG: ATP-dependent Clp protease ATP-binding subunit [Myxococcales bacterium]|nr:ATP-dependent Clp protease ATP-binding subunit [Myxococcales bacterium]